MHSQLITTVLVPAQTQPQQSNRAEAETFNPLPLLFVFLTAFLGIKLTLSAAAREQSNQAASNTGIENKTKAAQSRQRAEKEEENKRLRVQAVEQWELANIEKIKEHRYTLYEVWNQSISEDAYGNKNFKDWAQYDDYIGLSIEEIRENILKDRGFRGGWTYFWKNVLLEDGDFDGARWFSRWLDYRQEKLGNDTDKEWSELVKDWIDDHALTPVAIELDEAEAARAEAGFSEDMSGEDYEIYCGRILQEAGWNVEQTQASNDQGVDLIAQIENLKVCIQCKRYSNAVGNKAVQEVIAGRAFYSGTHAVVVSNAGFTKAAKSLAESADVILISDTELEDLEMMV